VAPAAWTLARPEAGQRALLADPGFVLPPDLERLAIACGEPLGYAPREVFYMLLGRRILARMIGPLDRRRKPSLLSTVADGALRHCPNASLIAA